MYRSSALRSTLGPGGGYSSEYLNIPHMDPMGFVNPNTFQAHSSAKF